MKRLVSVMVGVLLLSLLVVPAFAQESEGAANTFGDMPAELREIVTGRAGFSIYDDETPNEKFAARDQSQPEGMPDEVWQAINDRNGFTIYQDGARRSEGAGGLANRPPSMPAKLWSTIYGRDSFSVDASQEVVAKVMDQQAAASGLSQDMHEIIYGRSGFDTGPSCEVC